MTPKKADEPLGDGVGLPLVNAMHLPLDRALADKSDGVRLHLLEAARIGLTKLLPRLGNGVKYPGISSIVEAALLNNPCDLLYGRDDFDLVFGAYRLANDCCDLSEFQYSQLFEVLVSKIRIKGGKSAAPDQVLDLFYEAHIFHLTARNVPGIKLLHETIDAPDLLFEVEFQSTNETARLALECKNIRSQYGCFMDLVRATADKVREGMKQGRKRIKQGFSDYVVFVDLPASILWNTPDNGNRYICLSLLVRKQLLLEGLAFDDARVVYTAVAESEISTFLRDGKLQEPRVLRPVAVNRPKVLATRMVFHSFFFAKPGESVSIFNWPKQAIVIRQPSKYLKAQLKAVRR
jgi:hypothetical protein